MSMRKDTEPKVNWTTTDEYTATFRRAIQRLNADGIDAYMQVGREGKWLPKLDDNGSPLLTASGEIAFKIPTGEVNTVIEVWAPRFHPDVKLKIDLGSKQNPIVEPRIEGLKLFTWIEPALPAVKAEATRTNKMQSVLKLALEDAIDEVRKRLALESANLTGQAATQAAPPSAAPTSQEQTAAVAGHAEASRAVDQLPIRPAETSTRRKVLIGVLLYLFIVIVLIVPTLLVFLGVLPFQLAVLLYVIGLAMERAAAWFGHWNNIFALVEKLSRK